MQGSATGDRISLATRGNHMDKYKDKKNEDGVVGRELGKGKRQSMETGIDDVFVVEAEENKSGKATDAALGKEGLRGHDEPFARRSALARTPPPKRTHSLPDEKRERLPFSWEERTPSETDVDKDKRKRVEESPTDMSTKETLHKRQKEERKHYDSEGKTAEKFKSMWEFTQENRGKSSSSDRLVSRVTNLMMLVGKETAILNKLVIENKNTKVHIKDSISNLDRLVSQLMTPEISRFIEGKTSVRETDQALATASIAVQTGPMHKESTGGEKVTSCTEHEERAKKYTTVGTQTEGTWENGEIEDIRRKICENRGYEGYRKISLKEWPKEVYSKVREKLENPIWDGSENELGFFIVKEDTMNKGIYRQIKRRFPEAEEIHKIDEGCVTAVYETRIEKPNTEDGDKGRRSLSRIRMEKEDLKMYMNILAWKEKIKEWGVRKVAVWETEANWGKIKSMMEHIFCGEDIQVMAYTSGEGRGGEKGGREKLVEAVTKKKNEKRNRGETEAVVVSATDKNYEELVRKVKAKVDVQKLGIKIRNIRSTRQGDVLLTLEGKGNEAGRLEEEINGMLAEEGINARKGGERTVVVHLKGLDITATTEEVKQAISDKYGSTEAQTTVRAMRSAYGRTQNATVILPEKVGITLIREGTIRIGWTICRAFKRVELVRCTRCWRTGHRRRECRGPDRTGMCLRCAKEGHQVKDCTNVPRCPVCDVEGHRADSAQCPAYGEALRKAIRRNGDRLATGETEIGRGAKTEQPLAYTND